MNRLDAGELRSLIRAASAVVEAGDLKNVLTTAVTMARKTTGARFAALGVRNEHGTLEEFIHEGMNGDQAVKVGHLPMGHGLLGEVIEHPETIIVDDLRTHPSFVGFPHHHPGMSNFLGVPISAGEAVFGNFYLTDKPGGFGANDAIMVEALAAIVGAAVSAARLHQRIGRMALVEDRERIARDLHDAVIQELFAVGLGLQALQTTTTDERIVTRLDQAISGIDEAIDSLRGFIFDLRSVGVSVIDPETTVTRLVNRLVSNSRITPRVLVRRVDPAQADLFDDALQVVREAVSNTVRHSGATEVEVEVVGDERGITVTVSDNGCGFDPVTIRRGMGLANIRLRVDGREGSLELRSDAGTTMKARLLV